MKKKVTGLASFKAALSAPYRITVGGDKNNEGMEMFVRRVPVAEFNLLTQLFGEMDNKVEEGESQDEATAALVQKFSSLLVRVVTDEKGQPAFTEDDEDEVGKTFTVGFMRDFMKAFMNANGVNMQETKDIEASFRERPDEAG